MSKIKDSVVVITGASSGIGRTTALMFAKKGAKLVLAARGETALNEAAAECQKLGSEVLVVPTDISDEQAVQNLAQKSIQKFGQIDIWVNNAGVYMVGKFDDTPTEDIRRVIEINLFGCIYGARAVMPIFRRQNSGTLINISSLLGKVPQAYTSAYDISKFGVRSLGASLRQELLLDKKKINVCTVMPAAIDTPLFATTANYAGRKVRPPVPVFPPETVAKTILKVAQHPQNEIFAGKTNALFDLQYKIAPGLTEKMVAGYTDKLHFVDGQKAAPTSGNLYASKYAESESHGGWKKSDTGKRLMLVGSLAAAFGVFVLLRSRRR